MENNVVAQGNSKDVSFSNSYEDAMDILSSLISQKRCGDNSDTKRINNVDMMLKYLKVLNLEEHIDRLKIIHVSGTKGKGSTCTFCESILRECGFRTGLFTSPHLIDVRERYRINGLDISEEKFLMYFWRCYNQLKEKITEDLPMPRLFQFLTLLAFKIFVSEKVDVAIIEVGLGGTRDSTNFIKEPVVCGVTSLGMDHMEILGDSLEKIASQKAGIFKPRVPAFTVHQQSEAMHVLWERATELKIPLTIASPLDQKRLSGVKLGLNGEHQFINATLAVSLCRCWLTRTGNSKYLITNKEKEDQEHLPESFLQGLSTASFAGRAQIIHDMLRKPETANIGENSSSNLIFYIDGAHTPESMEICAHWFSSAVKEDIHSSATSEDKVNYNLRGIQNGLGNSHVTTKFPKQILLFNCMEVRDPQLLLPKLMSTCASKGAYFSKALFAPSISSYSKVSSGASLISSDVSKDLRWQFTLQRTWEKIIHGKDGLVDIKSENTEKLPSYDFLYEELADKHNPSGKHLPCSAVMPSLPVTIKWLRDCAKENPSIRLQVLVTGSLHLVGDVLKLIRR